MYFFVNGHVLYNRDLVIPIDGDVHLIVLVNGVYDGLGIRVHLRVTMSVALTAISSPSTATSIATTAKSSPSTNKTTKLNQCSYLVNP